ncbi:hypothetical protein OPV22_016453 [Ensete ventricosum]|uniref:Uncharacterized protein n=1 Tax=Ensete ventricosum TaxID=4639 RepID=A0AAV8QTV5_ENSVE|nr:hypothetical protein OPV22_016453 [Ensete ventricosum]
MPTIVGVIYGHVHRLGLTHLEFSSFGLIWWAEISIWKLHSSLFSWASGRICRVSWVDLRSITARIRGRTALCEAKEGNFGCRWISTPLWSSGFVSSISRWDRRTVEVFRNTDKGVEQNREKDAFLRLVKVNAPRFIWVGQKRLFPRDCFKHRKRQLVWVPIHVICGRLVESVS